MFQKWKNEIPKWFMERFMVILGKGDDWSYTAEIAFENEFESVEHLFRFLTFLLLLYCFWYRH